MPNGKYINGHIYKRQKDGNFYRFDGEKFHKQKSSDFQKGDILSRIDGDYEYEGEGKLKKIKLAQVDAPEEISKTPAKMEVNLTDLPEHLVRKGIGEFGWKLTALAAAPTEPLEKLVGKGLEKVGLKAPPTGRETAMRMAEAVTTPEAKRQALMEKYPISTTAAEMIGELPYYLMGGSAIAVAKATPAAIGAITGAIGGAIRTQGANTKDVIVGTLGEAALGMTLGKATQMLGWELDPVKKEALEMFKKYQNTVIRDIPINKIDAFVMPEKTPTLNQQLDDLIAGEIAPTRWIPRKPRISEDIIMQKKSALPELAGEKIRTYTPSKKPNILYGDIPDVQGSITEGVNAIKPKQRSAIPVFDNITKEEFVVEPSHIAMIKRTTATGETRIPAIRRKSGFYAKKEIEIQPIKDVGGQATSPLNTALAQDNIARETGRFGTIYNNMHQPTQEAIAQRTVWRQNMRDRFIHTAKQYRINTNSKKEGNVLREIMEQVSTKDLDILSPDEIITKYPILSGIQKKYITAAKDYRGLYEMMRDQANSVRQELGMNNIGYIDKYVPHMQKVGRWNDLLREESSKISEVLDFIIPNEKTNPFAMKRLTEGKDFETNLFKLTDNYISSVSNDIFLTPAIENIKVNNAVLKSRGLNKAAAFWDEYVRTGLVGKTHALDRIAGFTPKSFRRQAALKLQEIRIKGALLGNIVWSTATQPSSLALTVKEAGIKNTMLGMWDYFTNKGLRNVVKETTSMRIKGARGSTTVYRGIADHYDQMIYRSPVTRFNDLIGVLMNAEEKHLHGMSVAAGIREGKRLGFKGKDLMNFANNVGEVTTTMYNREARPLILNSDLFRTSFPFQTFAFEALGHLRQMVGKTGMPASARKRLGMAVNLLAGIGVANAVSQKIRGRGSFNIDSFVPVVGPAIQNAAYKAMGKSPYERAQREPVAVIEDLSTIAGGISDYVKYDDKRKLRKALVFYGMGAAGLGGALQVNRFIDGLIAAEAGEYVTPSGKEGFRIEGAKEKTKAILLGPYGTEAGKEYLERKVRKETPLGERITGIRERLEEMIE